MLIVFGSINMDMIVAPEHLPEAGETVMTLEYDLQPGGKGANQALAACRMGAKTALVGCAGEDSYSRQILDVIRRQGVITSGVTQSETYRTGCAIVMQEKGGANRSIIVGGANIEARAEQVPDEILRPDSMILTQTEVPPQEVFTLIRRANERGVKVIMNLAPAVNVPEEILGMLHILVVNEIELAHVANGIGLSGKSHADIAHALAVRGKLTCIVTLADKGSIVVTADGVPFHVSSLPVEVVDTTGAGDAYCGTLAACLYDGKSLEESVRWASVAGSLACAKVGTIKAFAYEGDIRERLDEIVVTK